MGIPVPPPEAPPAEPLVMGDTFVRAQKHVFVRVRGLQVAEVRALLPGLEVVACSHDAIDGGVVTEALVSGADAVGAVAAVARGLRGVEFATAVSAPDWVRQCVLTACGGPVETLGAMAVLALRAPDDELHLLTHPHAPSAADIFARLARRFSSVLDRA